MKALGSEIVQFFKEGFPAGYYIDDSTEDIRWDLEGWPILEPSERYEIDDIGVLVKEDDPNGDAYSLARSFAKWKKSLTTVTILVEVGKEKEAAVRSAIKAAGGRVR